jgi:hypothetical protein
MAEIVRFAVDDYLDGTSPDPASALADDAQSIVGYDWHQEPQRTLAQCAGHEVARVLESDGRVLIVDVRHIGQYA